MSDFAQKRAAFNAGYELALGKPRGWDAPHPMNQPHPRYFYAGMNAALEHDGLTLSAFLRAIPTVEARAS